MKRNFKKFFSSNDRAITIIALAITIIILMILAGVSITFALGENGITQLAQNSENEINDILEGSIKDIEDIKNEVNDYTKPPSDKKPTTIKEAIDSEYRFEETTTLIDETTDLTIPVPAGFIVLGNKHDNKVKYSSTPSINDGIVIAEAKTISTSGKSEGNEFVWVPIYSDKPVYSTENGKKVGQLYDFSKDSSGNVSSSKRLYEEGNSYREPAIVVGDDKKSYDANQSYYKTILGLSGPEAFEQQLQKEFDEMIESITYYKGFYIGRYETGNLSEKLDTIPIVAKGRIDISNANWYYIYQNSKKILGTNNESAKTSMIWGCLWDATLNWFLKSSSSSDAKYVVDSANKGNYKGAQIEGESVAIATGTNEDYAVKNIYDMAGNMREFELSAHDANARTYRGGSCSNDADSSHSAGSRSYTQPSSKNIYYGSRAIMYIKK